jgi:hypothetical protein
VGSVSPLNSGCHITVVLLMAALHNTTAVSDQAKAAHSSPNYSNSRILAVMVCLQNGQSIILLPQPSHVWWPQLKARRRGASRHTAHRRESALACRWDSAMLRCSTTCRTALVHASSLPASIGNQDVRQQHDHQPHTTQSCCRTYAQQYGLGYMLYK